MESRFMTRALVLAAFVVLAGCLGSINTPGSADGVGPRTIQVTATGTASGEPDEAVLTIGVTAVAQSADAARNRVATNVSSMRAALRDAGVTDDQIQTTAFFIGEDPQSDETDVRGFRATHLFRITLTDVDSVGEIIDVAIQNGATDVQNVQFTLSDDREREVRAAALSAAMENAREQGETLADAGALTIVDVHSVETVEQSFFPAFERGGDGSTSIEPGPVMITAQVQVVYNATG